MKADPVKLEIFKSLYSSVAEEMGVSLRRSAFSPNIKERRDYSCAVFNREGVLIAQGDHMPVHLGSMPMSVKAALETLDLQPGDIAVLNDPYAGGTHLPDVTMVAAVFDEGRGPGVRGQGEDTANTITVKSNKRSQRKNRPPPPRPPPPFSVSNPARHAHLRRETPGSTGRSA